MSKGKFRENLGFVADILTLISTIISVIIFFYPVVLGNGTPILEAAPETKFGIISKSDVIFLSAVLGIFVLWGITYVTWIKIPNNQFLKILGFCLDAITFWFYFRFWIGINWWIYVCVIPALVVAFILMFLFSRIFNIGIDSGNPLPTSKNAGTIDGNFSQPQEVNLPPPSPFCNNSSPIENWYNTPKRVLPQLQIPDGTNPFIGISIREIADSYNEDLPYETNRQMVDLTNYLLQNNLLDPDFAILQFRDFVNIVKDQQTLTYSDVLNKFGKDAANKINFS